MSADLTPHLATELRAQLGIQRATKARLSRDTGISTASLSRYFNGTRDVPVAQLDRLAHALGVPASVIVQRAEQRRAAAQHDDATP